MTPLLVTKTPPAPVGDASAGDGRVAQATASVWREAQAGANPEVFTNHEARDTSHGFFRITDFAAVRFSVGARGVAPPETAVRTSAPADKSLFSSSPLFTIVHYCSPLFTKKYCPAPVPSCRPVAAFLRVVARHGRHGAPRATVREPSSPAT